MMSANLIEQPLPYTYSYSQLIAALGAFGTALQNYPAVVLFLQSTTRVSPVVLHTTSFATGALASGIVNFWMNAELLEDFYTRLKKIKNEGNAAYQRLDNWGKFIYILGVCIFIVTGILFGLTAFAFAATGPLAILSNVAGILVTIIMIIQEVETWMASYEKEPTPAPTTTAEWIGKYCGHLIAWGNVLALSLLFTLGVTQMLIGFQVAAFPALMIGLSIAFTFGAFTEFFFYNAYLAEFGQKFAEKWAEIINIQHTWFGLGCTVTNALVNTALTYAGIQLLAPLLVAASITLFPPLALTVLAAVSAVFAGLASLILGTALWIRQNKPQPILTPSASSRLNRFGQFGDGSVTPSDPDSALEVSYSC